MFGSGEMTTCVAGPLHDGGPGPIHDLASRVRIQHPLLDDVGSLYRRQHRLVRSRDCRHLLEPVAVRLAE